MTFKGIIISFCAACLLTGCAGGEDNGRTPGEYHVWGIDISRYQQDVDWQKVAENNRPDFVLLKATEGTMIEDPTYKKRSRELERLGILWGAYHFFGHRSGGKEQAEAFISTARLKTGNLVPVVDIEPHRDMADPAKMVKELKSFCRALKTHYGVNPVIYCPAVFYQTHLAKDFPAKRYDIWLADYRGKAPAGKWKFWQHTDLFTMKGIEGNVDRNVFCGTMDELMKMTLK